MPTQPWYSSRLACPDCKGKLDQDRPDMITCRTCSFARPKSAPLNLMPVNPRPTSIAFHQLAIADLDLFLAEVDLSEPQDTYRGPVPRTGTPMVRSSFRDTALLMSQVAAARPDAKTVLDLGCGPRDKFPYFEFMGCDYVGLDIPGAKADVLGDAHYLPFADQTFDVVYSYAVVEHLHNPFVALTEIRRVLRPGGIFVGSVSQGEPSHKSFFHHTPWALISLCQVTGMQITRLWPAWDTLEAVAYMGRYPRVIRVLLRLVSLLDVPALAPRRMLWEAEPRKRLDRLHQAGALCFCIRVPNE